jgi:DNA processing protein
MTKYGETVVEKFVPELVANRFCLISGFMYGIDSAVHRTCVEYGGITVAVLGSGLDEPSVPENDDLYTKILVSGGLVISEYEKEFKPTLWSFPQRNRIVSGLSTKGILVIEAGMKSGSLVTARIAKEQGKKVYAIPGQIINGNSEGTNWLIAENQAKMILSVEEITNQREVFKQEDLFENCDEQEKGILNLIKLEPLTIDELARKLEIDIGNLSVKISMMSLSGKLIEFNGKIYKNG